MSDSARSMLSQSKHRGAVRFDQTTLGIAFFLLGIALQCVMEACVKLLATGYPIGQIVFLRSFLAFGPMAILILAQGDFAALRPRRLSMHGLRGLLMVGTISIFFTSLKHMPLADATAIFLLAPLFMTALSGLFLGERARLQDYAALGLGLLGALVMLQPGTEVFRIEGLLPATAALFYALVMIVTRSLTRTESTGSILIYGNLVVVAAGLLTLPFGWVWPSATDAALFLLVGFAGGFSVYFLILALRHAAVSILAPLDYTAFLWAIGLGLLLWHELPTLLVWIGATLIVSSGMFVTLREARPRAGPS